MVANSPGAQIFSVKFQSSVYISTGLYFYVRVPGRTVGPEYKNRVGPMEYMTGVPYINHSIIPFTNKVGPMENMAGVPYINHSIIPNTNRVGPLENVAGVPY